MRRADDEAERERLLGELTLREKVRLLTATTLRTRAEPALGLREMVLSDGPAGVRGQSWDERAPALPLPSASALGALWNEELVECLGGLLAAEAHRKGVDVLLAPNLSLHRTPLAGRHFECFSEDPELTGRTGAALVRGVQAQGVAATAKHYVADDSETDRLTVDVRVSERVLREVYLAGTPGPLERPERWLAGYAAVNADPGERASASVRIPARALRHWAEDEYAWRTQPGPCRVLAGRSAGALPLTATVLVRAPNECRDGRGERSIPRRCRAVRVPP